LYFSSGSSGPRIDQCSPITMYVNSVAPNRRIGYKCREVEVNNPGGTKSFLRSDDQLRGQTIAYFFSHPEAHYPIGKYLVPSPCTHRRSYYSPSSRLRSPSDLFHSQFPITILYKFYVSPFVLHVLSISPSILLTYYPLMQSAN
jgi:hypothetical protein